MRASGAGRAGAALVRGGFTLVEVVVSLLVLELAVVAAVGTITVASATLGRAERLERATALAEGLLDSLEAAPDPGSGEAAYLGGELRWTVGADGHVDMIGRGPAGDTLLEVESVLPPAARP